MTEAAPDCSSGLRRSRFACGLIVALALIATPSTTAHAGLFDGDRLAATNRSLAGTVLDFTHNHGADHRLFSTILGMKRDLYVYLPPGYTPSRAYPLILYFHGAFGDEHSFLDGGRLEDLDRLIREGRFPPCIVACPDGTYSGRDTPFSPQSFFVNGLGGRVEDHILCELVPFLESRFSIRPERQARALLGICSGGFGALSLAIRHRHRFGAVATLSPAANLRYKCHVGRYREDFHPATFCWEDEYKPFEVVGRYARGLIRFPACLFLGPVFGCGAEVTDRIARVNPADLLFTSGILPGELDIYIHYAGLDNFNFDAQSESFIWLASQRGIAVTVGRDPEARHKLPYFRDNQKYAVQWLASHLLPPTDAAPYRPAVPLVAHPDGSRASR